MGDRYLTDLADVLRDNLVAVVEVDGWEFRARSSGGYGPGLPWAVVWHHTASDTSPENDVGYICFGCPDAPVANLYLDRGGTVWVCAGGASNTNGKGGPAAVSRGTIPVDSANTHVIGIEAANDGVGQAWPQAQIDAYFRVNNALAAAYGFLPADCLTHHDWTPGRKIDPATAAAVAGPWRPGSVNTSGTWSLVDIRAEATRRATLGDDEMSQADIDAINARLDTLTAAVNDRQAVWNQPTVGNQSHANNPSLYLGDLWDAIQNISARLSEL